ncbi:hypothetical protein DNTS_032746 [Danionella cerebrum]|uniref:Coiled-coil SMC6 And NSE5 INteracting (CANIN) domain-containing protein n=1 Tax=Danionella cerebrum TaxID=2873325 RepID=A0A553NW25_9TELE|nr:hypothetical protein DNTS_032746 [Danionella translucida]
MSSFFKQKSTFLVNKVTPQHNNVDATSHAAPGLSKSSWENSKCFVSLPKYIPPSTNGISRKSSTATLQTSNKSSRTERDNFKSLKDVRNLQPNSGTVGSATSPALKQKRDLLQRTISSYSRDREASFALSRELNENLRVGEGLFRSMTARRHSLTPTSLPRRSPERRKTHLFQLIPKHSAGHSDDGKQPRDQKASPSSNMFGQKELTAPHKNTSPEGGLSLSAKRKSNESTDSEREMKRPRVNPPHSSRMNSSPKYVKQAFLNNSADSPITLKDFPPKSHSPASNCGTKLKPTSTIQLFKSSTEVQIGKTDSSQSTKSSQPNLFNVSQPPTFAGSDTLCTPNNRLKAEGESVSKHHNESVKSLSDWKISSFTEQASACKMNPDERALVKVEQSRSPGAIEPGPGLSVKVEGADKAKHCPLWKDPLDIELEYGSGDELREHCAISLSSSSSGHDDEYLPSLKEILDWSVRVPVTPEKDAFSEPSTPVTKPAWGKSPVLAWSKELERQLLESYDEDPVNIDDDKNSESKEEDISLEHREFLRRFSMASCAIREVHPGEEIFTPARFGQLFSHQMLDIRKINVIPQNRSQKILLQSLPENVLSLISAGLLRNAYFSSPCQPEVTHWLFQMMSVHPNPIVCSQILESLQTIAVSAAGYRVEQQIQSAEVWVPSVRDITLVLMNIGASFISLFPLETLQPPFTEGELLENVQLEDPSQIRVMSNDRDDAGLPGHNLEGILKYLSLCTALCPKSYPDEELLLLLAMTCRMGLDPHFHFEPTTDLRILLENLLKNITHWDAQISNTCQTLTGLTEDHHNLRRIVSLLPDSSRGKQLKRYLSVSIISKLLNHTCSYVPSSTQCTLSLLQNLIPKMRPSSLVENLLSSRGSEDAGATTLDQQAYYLCYTLLALTNEASNLEVLSSTQRNDLRSLSSLLEKHIKCDIRESGKMLYRSKVKDFVARIYTRWQALLTRTRPQKGKLYDYWKPPPEDEMPPSDIEVQDSSESAEETAASEELLPQKNTFLD